MDLLELSPNLLALYIAALKRSRTSQELRGRLSMGEGWWAVAFLQGIIWWFRTFLLYQAIHSLSWPQERDWHQTLFSRSHQLFWSRKIQLTRQFIRLVVETICQTIRILNRLLDRQAVSQQIKSKRGQQILILLPLQLTPKRQFSSSYVSSKLWRPPRVFLGL